MYNVDPYDDGRVLLRELPSVVRSRLEKSAEDLSINRDYLPDSDFALVLVDPEGEVKFRKFACVDEGNVAQSVFYFLKNWGELPPEAVKVAAQNLLRSALDCDLTPPEELIVLAGESDPMPDNNMVVVKVSSKKPEVEKVAYVPSPADELRDDLEYYWEHKGLMDPREKRAFAKDLVSRAEQVGFSVPMELDKYAGDRYSPYLEAAITYRCALCAPSEPTDESIKQATMMKRAYVELFRSSASLHPEKFAEELAWLDECARVGELKNVPDAILTTFGPKTAEKKESDGVVYEASGVVIRESKLRDFASRSFSDVRDLFGETAAEELRKRPKAVFDSLPAPQKRLLANLISQDVGERGA